MLTELCKGTLLGMRLTVGVRSVLRCESDVTTHTYSQSDAFSTTYPYTTRHAATTPY